MTDPVGNTFIDVVDIGFSSPVDLSAGGPPPGSSRTIELTQSRLAIFLKDADRGLPLIGLPVFVVIECEMRYRVKPGSPATPPDEVSKTLPDAFFSARVPLGLLASDHLGYLSYDLSRLPDLVVETDVRWKELLGDAAVEFQSSVQSSPLQIALRAIWIHPYGDYPFDALRAERYALRPDAIVVVAALQDNPVRAETARAGIPSMQEPSIVDWRLSPGSFAITPLLEVGADDCARITPANLAIHTFYFQQVVFDAPADRTPATHDVASLLAASATPRAATGGGDAPRSAPAPGVPAVPGLAPTAVGGLPSRPTVSPAAVVPAATSSTPPVGPTLDPTAGHAVPSVAMSMVSAPAPVATAAAMINRAEVRRGTLLLYRTQWFPLGHSLGNVLYSLALAPAESANIAVIDWSREDTAIRDETTGLTEAVIADLRRDRTIRETITGALKEKQEGGSTMGGGSLAAGAAGSTGAMGAMLGLAMSIGGGSAWTSASRDLQFSTVQSLADRISQSASAVRELESSVVVSAHQREQNALTTRNLTNYNHSHTLTILYYELLRHLRVVTAFDRAYDAYLVKFPGVISVNRSDPLTVLQYASLLRGILLDPSLEPALDACAALEIELHRPDPAAQRTADQDLILYGLTGALSVTAAMDVEPNQTAAAFRVFRREVSNGGVTFHPVRLAQSNPLSRLDWSSQDDGTQFFYPLPRVHGDYKETLTVSFSLMLGETLRWGDLSHIEVQCVFDDDNHDKRYQIWLQNATALTERGPLTLTVNSDQFGIPNSTEYLKHQWEVAGKQYNVYYTNPCELWVQGPGDPPAPRPPFERLTPDQQQLIWRLLNHVADHAEEYSLRYWWMNDWARGEVLAGLGTAFDASFTPVDILGGSLVFPRLTSNPRPQVDGIIDERLITLPTRGVFADAKLGECNVSEFIDDRRFWDWQQSPIPFPPPEISGVHPESQKQAPTGLQPTQFPTPVVSIQNAPAAPDPSTAAALQAFTTPNIFRDMSIAQQVAGVVAAVTQAAVQVAQAAGSLVKGKATGGTSGGTGAPGSGQGGGSSTQTPSGPATDSGGGPSQSSTQPPVPQSQEAGQGGSGQSTGGGRPQTSAPGKATNRDNFRVSLSLPPAYKAIDLEVNGLTSEKADPGYKPILTKSTVNKNLFIVTYSPDKSEEICSIELTVTIEDRGGNRDLLFGHHTTNPKTPLSRLQLLTCTPATKDVTVTARKDITDSRMLADSHSWDVKFTLGGEADLPTAEVAVDNLAKVKGWDVKASASASVGYGQEHQQQDSHTVLVSDGANYPTSVIDFGVKEMHVDPDPPD